MTRFHADDFSPGHAQGKAHNEADTSSATKTGHLYELATVSVRKSPWTEDRGAPTARLAGECGQNFPGDQRRQQPTVSSRAGRQPHAVRCASTDERKAIRSGRAHARTGDQRTSGQAWRDEARKVQQLSDGLWINREAAHSWLHCRPQKRAITRRTDVATLKPHGRTGKFQARKPKYMALDGFQD